MRGATTAQLTVNSSETINKIMHTLYNNYKMSKNYIKMGLHRMRTCIFSRPRAGPTKWWL